MVLVDTSVWTDHIRSPVPELSARLAVSEVLMHPFIIGELALGNLPDRTRFLADLMEMPPAEPADDQEVLAMIEVNGLSGKGVGWVDVHLIASARLRPGTVLWTRDRRMSAVSREMGVPTAGLH